VANYTFGSFFTNCLPHLKGEKVFASTKWLVDCPLGVNKIPIILILWISLIHRYPFWLLNLILWRMYTFNNCHLVLVICYLCYLEVAWSWKKIFMLMASGVLNVTHPNL
jgi:hypothetical protein